MTPFGLSTVLRVGKYRGLAVEAVIKFNPGYLAWIQENWGGVRFEPSVEAALRPALRHEREQASQRQNGWAWGFGREVRSAADAARSRAIRIEHEERRKAGQVTCECFPNNWQSCPQCKGSGWVTPAQGMSAGTAKTPKAVEGEARQPGTAKQDAPND